MIDVSARRLQAAVLEWEVVDLLLSDDRVVAEMFEDIVTTEWPPPPGAPGSNRGGAGGRTAGAEKREPPAGGPGLIRQRRVHRPGTDGWARERSPPKHRQRSRNPPAWNRRGDALSRDATIPE